LKPKNLDQGMKWRRRDIELKEVCRCRCDSQIMCDPPKIKHFLNLKPVQTLKFWTRKYNYEKLQPLDLECNKIKDVNHYWCKLTPLKDYNTLCKLKSL
jgi:hypothetical protein